MRGAITFALLAGVLAGQTAEDSKGTIRGTVKDSNGLPVSGITVEAYRGSEPQIRRFQGGMLMMGSAPVRANTDEAGKYSLANLAPATYSLKTERDAESSTYRRVKVDAGEEVILDIVVPAKPNISGQVLDQDGDPRIDALVWLLKPEYVDGSLRQTVIGPIATNEDGSYSFESDLEPNRRYYLLVDRDLPKKLDLEKREPIEVPTYYPSASRMDLATPVILQPGENRRKVDIKIATAPFYCVGGKIQSAADFEIREVALAGTRLVRLRGSPDEHGKYRVCGLSPGEYRLSGERAATDFTVLSSDLEHVDLSTDLVHFRVQAEWDDPANPPTAPKLNDRTEAALRKIATALGIEEASDADLLRIGARVVRRDSDDTALNDALARMPDGANERGYLTGFLASGNSLLTVALSSEVAETDFSVAVPSDVQMGFGLPPADYAIEFQVFGKITTYPKEMTYNDVKITDSILRLTPGSSGTLHLVMATDFSTLVVTVKDALDNPVPGASVVLIPDSVTAAPALSRFAVRGQADQNGSYTSPPLAPGKYRVLATTQTIRWNVPEDLDKVLLAALQARSAEVAGKATAAVTVEPVTIF